ncbi:MAG: xanthine dehydrogenase family protein molybdopterin-binding subunit [Terracidiphilus sp.]|jgi:xanthine dehydrogenase YagR molybdenum-binding subunit
MTAIGDPLIRVDGHAKVTGAAKYAAEFDIPNIAHAVMVTSTIPNGRITSMITVKAQSAPGVVIVMTPANAPKLPQGGKAGVNPPAGRVLSLLQDNTVLYNNQPIAVVVAETLDQALYAASLIDVKYQEDTPKLDFEAGMPAAHPGSHGKDPADVSEGQLNQALAAAEVKLDEIYTTPIQNHNPMEPHATIAQWDGDKLTLHDATQYISGVKQTVAKALGIPQEDVHTICPFTGGGFGCKGSTWSHVVLAAMAAKVAQRPVKLALERPQMFGPVGARPRTHQRIVLAAKRDGTLTAIAHHVHSHTSVFEDFTEPSSVQTRMLYESPSISTSQRLVSLNLGTPTFQRAPGESTGTFALEIAMDELACKLNIDPIELRLKNYAEKDPTSKKPFSSKHLRECYQQGVEHFGWSKRNPAPRSIKRNGELIGLGVATATYPANRSTANARVQFEPSGRVAVASGSQELGTGMYTIMAQVAAATLKLPVDIVDARLGDSTLPKAPVSGGSQSAASVTPAVQAAAKEAQLTLLTAASNDARGPFAGTQPDQLVFENGMIRKKGSSGTGEHFKDFLARNGNNPIGANASAEKDQDAEQYSTHSWGAVFAEVGVDELTGMVHVHRIVGVYDVGTLLNQRTGKSQLIGGIVWGIGLALHEETHFDTRHGRPINNNLAEYHVPVNADIGEIEVYSLDIPDTKFNPLGARGIGEIGITGTGAAIANAIYHATGKRLRNAPITPEMLIG